MSNDQQPPWGQKKRPQSPEEMVAQLISKIQNYFAGTKKNSSGGDPEQKGPRNPMAGLGKIFSIILFVILLQAVYASFFKIAPSEVGVILRLGEYNKTVQAGLHFKIPFIDVLHKVDVEEIRKEEFGFRSRQPGQTSTFNRSGYDMESLMLTADKNVINVAWIVQFRVMDPQHFLFKVKDVRQAVRDVSESVTRRIVGNMDFDYVLSNRDVLAAAVKSEIQSQLNTLESGIAIGTVQFQDINPPDQVKPAFNEVNEADQDMKRLVNEAEETYNRVIPKARGSALRMVEEAHGYSINRTNEAKGETERFLDILREYKNATDVTRQRMYLETMQEIIPSVQSLYIMDEGQSSPLPLLNLSGNKAAAGK
ncbi:MAG: FtsH protease activity modulator HflK [Desulfobulbaceae bacterium]|uniref:Protein HflK n=1 Tax=Candidatus Desulfatifera sulfidica TaxID=2841691 RepID=A0A8J6TA86_9BACT|nr:FtsH protease activity modulator HflK [Candidatus Desulfatifera sulfidica]